MRPSTALFPSIALSFFICASCFAEHFTGKVVGVTDGDTIKVMRNGSEVKVRLYGIDAPEQSQAYGTKAKSYLSNKIFGKQVRIDIKDIDRYGRTVGVVISSSGENINNSLVKDGYAWWYKQYAPKDLTLRKSQYDSQKAKKGLWSDSRTPISPWEFRRNPKSKSGTQSQSVETSEILKQYNRSRKTNNAPSLSPRSSYPTRQVDNSKDKYQSVTVYVTRTGKKYHRSGCRYLSKFKIPKSLSSVKGRYGVCSFCRP
jgi:endonuclease YncB( thermonuclease family)